MNYLQAQNLAFRYDKEPILEAVNLIINKGEFIGVFGPNGGGKTTFLKLLMGFLKPSEGFIHLSTTKIGYVPQVTRFDKQFPISVLEIILMGFLSKCTWWGAYPSEAKQKAKQALERVGLKGKEKQPFGTLSGGQAQRVLIARAIVNDPELLLLDEPTANIDIEAEAAIYKLLEELRHSMTILIVTHDIKGILGKVDRLLCIHRTAKFYAPKEVCNHVSLGLYHSIGE